MTTVPLDSLVPGQLVPFGGDRAAVVGDDLAAAFRAGDRLVVVHETGDLLHVPAADHAVASAAVRDALAAFHALHDVGDDAITSFFDRFAELLADDDAVAPIVEANARDVESARARGRSTTRLELTAGMRADMVRGLRTWRDSPTRRAAHLATTQHRGWRVEQHRAPLGVVGFVFEGRPNVFADATGVLRTGNTVVFRIGSDALGTARAIMELAVAPALEGAGLPAGAVGLVDATAHAAGWALFADPRLSLAVARGSGRAVAQLGAVARQHGVPVSLHGTGGAWMVVAPDADPAALGLAVEHSLDRKVCNTLNVCCVVRAGADRLLPVVLDAVVAAGRRRGTTPVVHPVHEQAIDAGGRPLLLQPVAPDDLATEWEWEDAPELAVVLVDSVEEAVRLCNRCSPRFAASLLGGDEQVQQRFYDTVDAPFVGNGFTRWVDGQFAFDQPELGLSNWQAGRLLARGGVLSGDSVHTVRTRAHIVDHTLHR